MKQRKRFDIRLGKYVKHSDAINRNMPEYKTAIVIFLVLELI